MFFRSRTKVLLLASTILLPMISLPAARADEGYSYWTGAGDGYSFRQFDNWDGVFDGTNLVINGNYQMNEFSGAVGADAASSSGPKSLLVTGGAELTAHNSILIGETSGSVSSITISGSDTTLISHGNTYIGNGASTYGYLNIYDGATFKVEGDVTEHVYVGYGSGSDGSLLVENGSTLITGDYQHIILGAQSAGPSIGTLSIGRNSTAILKGRVIAGQYSTSIGYFSVWGGSQVSLYDGLVLGQESGSDGTATFSDEGTVVNLIGETVVGSRGTGSMVISNGATVNTQNIDTIIVGEHAAPPGPYAWQGHGTGTLSIGGTYDADLINQGAHASGTLNAGYVAFGAGEGHLQFNITDADLYTFSTGVKGAGDIAVYNGKISLTGDYSAFTGDVAVQNGLLSIDTDSIQSSALSVSSAGSLLVNGSVSSAADTVTVNGGTLVNNGLISGTDYGVVLSGSGSHITNSGLISGGTASIHYATGGNALSITPTATFGNLVDFNSTTGNTTSFGVGSYTLAVADYLSEDNNISLNNSKQIVVYSNADTSSGSIIVVDAGSTAATASNVQSMTSSISKTMGDILSLEIDRNSPVYGTNGGTDMTLGYAEASQKSDGEKAIAKAIDGNTALDPFGNLFWTRAFGGRSNDSYSDTSSRNYGIAFGLDHLFGETRLGVTAGLGTMKNKADNNLSEVNGDTYFGGVYLRQPTAGFNFDVSVIAGSVNSDTERLINGGAEKATGRFDGWFVSPEVAVSRAYSLPLGWSLTPKGTLSYTHGAFDGYSETGSSADLSYDDRTSDALQGEIELKLSRSYEFEAGQIVNFSVSGALVNKYNLGDSELNASVSGTDFTVSTFGERNSFGGKIGLNSELSLNSGSALFAGVDAGKYTDDSWDYSANMGLKIRF